MKGGKRTLRMALALHAILLVGGCGNPIVLDPDAVGPGPAPAPKTTEAGNKAPSEEAVPLRLEVISEQSLVRPGHPVQLQLRLTNQGKRSLYVNVWMLRHYDMMRSRMTHNGEALPRAIHESRRYANPSGNDWLRLRPGTAWTTRICMGAEDGPWHIFGYVPQDPGTYQLVLTYINRWTGRNHGIRNGWTGKLESEPLTLTIVDQQVEDSEASSVTTKRAPPSEAPVDESDQQTD